MDETNILIPIDDERAKYISEVISNKTCKKILNYLTYNKATVSDIANELDMPINTVDYNIKKLIKADLIEKESHWWSTRGKKMPVYKVSNKTIIISPKSKGFINYSKYLVAFLITGFIAFILKIISPERQEVAQELADDMPGILTTETIERTTEVVNRTADVAFSGSLNMDIWAWFLFGAWFAILLFFIINLFSKSSK